MPLPGFPPWEPLVDVGAMDGELKVWELVELDATAELSREDAALACEERFVIIRLADECAIV